MASPRRRWTDDTYCGRNWGRYQRGRRTYQPLPAPTADGRKAKNQRKPRPKKPRKTKIDWPPDDELWARVEASSYVAVARELGVSNTAVRKRLRRAEQAVATGDGPCQSEEPTRGRSR